jgi:hypothetical protein
MDLQVTIAQVRVRNTSNGRTVYDVDCGDGVTRQCGRPDSRTRSTPSRARAAAQHPREGVAERAVDERDDQGVRSSWAGAAPEQPGGGGGGGGGFRRGGGGMSPEDKTRIAKMGAQGSAATLVGSHSSGRRPGGVRPRRSRSWTSSRPKLYKDARSHEKPESETQVLQTGAQGQVLAPSGTQSNALPAAGTPVATPASVAAGVPGVSVGAVQDASAEAPQAAPSDDIDWS